MSLDWLRRRRYRHFDLPIGESFAKKAMNPAFVAQHAFSPLIHYTKTERRYKKTESGKRAISTKTRPIKYASHRDACILAYYAHKIDKLLETYYILNGIGDSVIAYRSLGRSNYDFSAEVMSFVKLNSPVTILAFDVTSFFDNLDHSLLKSRLKRILGVTELTNDWIKVFRSFTRFHFVDRADLTAHPLIGPRLKERTHGRIASLQELKVEGIPFRPNPEYAEGRERGIPQGTPISASASNLYMIDFDAAARAFCDGIGALYRRYSDDILVVCKTDDAPAVEAEILRLIANEKLEIASHKTEKTPFGGPGSIARRTKAAQYLGFTLSEGGAAIRESSLSRQWRKMRRAVRRARAASSRRAKAGLSEKVHTKRLYRRFSYIEVDDGISVRPLRNFLSYGRRSAAVFGPDQKISQQLRRFERAALRELAALKKLGSGSPRRI